jgi:aconitase A
MLRHITRADGRKTENQIKQAVSDTQNEIEYYKSGGILQYELKKDDGQVTRGIIHVYPYTFFV